MPAERAGRDLYSLTPGNGCSPAGVSRCRGGRCRRGPGGSRHGRSGSDNSPGPRPVPDAARKISRRNSGDQGSVQGPGQGSGRTVRGMTTTKRLDPALRPNPTLPAYLDGNDPAERAVRAKVLETWARQWGTADELVLLASSRGEASHLNRLARAALRTAGRLTGPAVSAGDVELSPGDRVVTGAHGIGRPGGHGIPPGCLGDVRLVDPADGTAIIDFPAAGVIRLNRGG